MSQVLSGLLTQYSLTLLRCDGLHALLAIGLYPSGLQWWAAQTQMGTTNAKAVAWNDHVCRCDSGGCRAGSRHALEGATAGTARHVQLEWRLHWRPHRRGLVRRKSQRPIRPGTHYS